MPLVSGRVSFYYAAVARLGAEWLGGLQTFPRSIRRGLIGPHWSSFTRMGFGGWVGLM